MSVLEQLINLSQRWIIITLPTNLQPYNLFIQMSSCCPANSNFVVSNPEYFASLSNLDISAVQNFLLPISANKLVMTLEQNQAQLQNDHFIIYIESVYLLYSILSARSRFIELIQANPHWRLITVASLGTQSGDIEQCQHYLQAAPLYISLDLPAHHQVTTFIHPWKIIYSQLIVDDSPALIYSHTHQLKSIQEVLPEAVIFSLAYPNNTTKNVLRDQTHTIITDSINLASLDIQRVIIDRDLDIWQYLTLLSWVNVLTYRAKTIEVTFSDRVNQLVIEELGQAHNILYQQFNNYLKLAKIKISFGDYRQIILTPI